MGARPRADFCVRLQLSLDPLLGPHWYHHGVEPAAAAAKLLHAPSVLKSIRNRSCLVVAPQRLLHAIHRDSEKVTHSQYMKCSFHGNCGVAESSFSRILGGRQMDKQNISSSCERCVTRHVSENRPIEVFECTVLHAPVREQADRRGSDGWRQRCRGPQHFS